MFFVHICLTEYSQFPRSNPFFKSGTQRYEQNDCQQIIFKRKKCLPFETLIQQGLQSIKKFYRKK
ncbi:MAG: hypothetical protein C4308_10415 [Chitinophagaceae bacterium]